ncbi:MAG TPA: S8 family serine peptidase [Burkholderiaceae bacterium]
MKLALSHCLILPVLAAASLCSVAALASDGGPERAPHQRAAAAAESEARVIVKLRADSTLMKALSASSGAASGSAAAPTHAQALGSRLGLKLSDGRALGPRTQVIKGAGLSSRELADQLAAQPDVEYAVVDGRIHALALPNDPLYAAGQTGANVPAVGQWYLRAPTATGTTITSTSDILASINAEAAWAITNGSSQVVVADLDTGVRFDHPDLTSKLLPGYDFITSTSTSNDGDGRDADASDPGDFGCGETTSSWHGTQTAGIIGAATNNGVGMASVGHDVMVMPLRVLGCGGGFDSDIQAAMQWAVGISVPGLPANTHPAKVLNMSLGASGACSSAYADTFAQVNAAGAVAVVAAGNDGLAVGTPANCAGAIAVAGLRHAGTKVGYSDLGPQIALAAPAGNCVNNTGTCVYPLLTTANSGTTTPVAGAAGAIYTGSGDNASLGTSFSAPMVSGTAALMFSVNPGLSPASVLAQLKATTRPFPNAGAPAIQLVTNGPLVAVPNCTAPTGTAQASECYCTTSTCGAGMLDVAAAVSSVATLNAKIDLPSTSVVAGTAVTIDGLGSNAAVGQAIASYAWSTSDPTIATITPSTTSPGSATLTPIKPGTVTITLAVTDSTGQTASTSTVVTVTDGSATNTTIPTNPSTPSSGDSGGGGAMSLGWLLGWLASVIGVWVVTPRPQRRRA